MKNIKAYVLFNKLEEGFEGILAFENGWMPLFVKAKNQEELRYLLWNETQNRYKAIKNMGYNVQIQGEMIPMYDHEISTALHDLNKDESLRIAMENAFKIELEKLKGLESKE